MNHQQDLDFSIVCVKGPPGEGGLLLLPSPSSPSLQENYMALRRLQEQRSLLLFIHEFSRRAHLAAGFISRVTQLLERAHLKLSQTQSSWSSFRPSLVSIVQELRVHLAHWSSLTYRARSDVDLRHALVQLTRLIDQVRQSLDLLVLQALVLVERYVVLVLGMVVRSEVDSIPVEVLEEVLGAAGVFNHTVGELRVQHTATQRRTWILQQAHIPTPGPGLPSGRGCHPAGVGVRDLMVLLAQRHAHTAPSHLLTPPRGSLDHSDWTWDQLIDSITLKTPPQQSAPPTSSQALPSDSGSEPLWGVQQDQISVELLVRLLICSGDPLLPVTSQTPEKFDQSADRTIGHEPDLIQDHHKDSPETRSAIDTWTSPGVGADSEKDVQPAVTELSSDRRQRWSPSVTWLDLGRSALCAQVLEQYRPLLVTLCNRALWLHLIAPPPPKCASSINLQAPPTRISIVNKVRLAAQTDRLPNRFRKMLQDFSQYLLASTAHAQWDYEVCRSLGSTLKDKCLTDVNRQLTYEQSRGVMMSSTMERFLCLPPPLMSSLSSCQSTSRSTNSGHLTLPPSMLCLHRHTISLALATVQLSTVWVMSKSFQFLSSWSLNKFLLITQGDLKVLSKSLEGMLHEIQASESPSALHHHHHHHQPLLKKQLSDLNTAMSQLQTFSSVVLQTFSRDCKKMSGEIFEQTMPAAVHWRLNLRTGFPSSPSAYASEAAQSVIGQVLEGVAPLSDDARVQALSITMTAFMEAWMEHILRHRIKFSVQGALQLKQDFDCIREMIQSEQSGLSSDLHQRLLSLRVFQQVDSAVVCLLQQPQGKPYLRSRVWEPFIHCCPSHRNSIDSMVGSSITNLRCMEGEELTDPSVMTSDIPPVDPSSPGEPYLAPSAALGSTQQDWLDLRIHSSSTRRWRLPGLHCLAKTEP
ncbi:uncharacterized protein ccdc142 isoform X2 [Cheilinus undulatus]|uniref:uncharacterized protein ccdc142 isoform X2 n=1 Tax=Cheilinus undulatus TaxID=241271 RepID=UPI001BD4ABA3|nr:uncharacterized protein ccdc142 isoform X2 [Cheilinus undulatus]